MEILKKGSMEKAAEYDEKNDIKVRFECGRCGCEFVASSFAGECVLTSLSMPDVTEKWTAKCPEFGCNHPCYSDDEVIRDENPDIELVSSDIVTRARRNCYLWKGGKENDV